jgi:ribulose 1,5-bisphosphate carboxylase large subunit-like protein
MITKDRIIRGEALLQTLTPELQRILQRAPKTGIIEIMVWMKGNRLIGTAHKIIDQEQGKAPEAPA